MNTHANPRLITGSGASCDQDVIRAPGAPEALEAVSVRKPPLTWENVAEGEGFEPSRPSRAYPLSRRAHSAGLCDPSGSDPCRGRGRP